MSWQLVESDEALADLLAQHRGCAAVMVDTEFMRRNTFYPQVALLQLCFDTGEERGMAWLVDPLRVTDTAPIQRLFADESVVKVLHSPGEDLEVFQRWLGVLPAPLFDTQRAAALLDIGFGMGYRALVQEICDVDLPKGETRSDWLQRPLSTPQCDYASQDVTWLLHLWRELAPRCRDAGKIDWVLADARDAASSLSTALPNPHLRVKGAWKMPPRALAALQAICRWREDTARQRDKPRGWIIDDQACLSIAERCPTSLDALRNGLDLPAPVLRRHGQEIVDEMRRVDELADSELPDPLPAPLGRREQGWLGELKRHGRAIAGELGVAPEILLPAKDYELLLREGMGEPVEEPPHWRGWRRERVIAALRDAAGEMCR